MRILSLKYKFINCYLLEAGGGWIMIDTDWPDTLPQLMRLLKQENVRTGDIKHLIITHFHPDHAGITQDLKDLGIGLVLHESQVPFVDKLNVFFKKNPRFSYKDIMTGDATVVSSADSRRLLKSLGIDGELIHTPGHSDDSISLVIDGCCAFTGDLPDFFLVEAYDDRLIRTSWKLIQGYDVKIVYPAHGDSYTL